MDRILPIYYSTYGRYITKHRSIPNNIDCLKPVERRLLYMLHQEAKDKPVKSAKIIGFTIAELHPHGDISTYGSLVELVQRDLAIGEGNWGSVGMIEDDPPAAYRYTEVKLAPWVEKLAFEYIKYVPFEVIEYIEEAKFIPSPIPIGLIGYGIITGIAFHKTVIPRYSFYDLVKRLQWLLMHGPIDKNINIDEAKIEDLGPEIKPNIKDCVVSEINNRAYFKLLINGFGKIQIIPNGSIDKKSIHITGKSPLSTFNSLIKNSDKLNIKLLDLCGDEKKIKRDVYHIVIEPLKKMVVDLNELAQTIWKKYIKDDISFDIIICNDNDEAESVGIDDIIVRSYIYWRYTVLNKRMTDLISVNNKKFEIKIIEYLRTIIEKYNIKKLDDILKIYHQQYQITISMDFEYFDPEQNTFIKYFQNIDDDSIKEVYSKRSIKNLVEIEINLNAIDLEIQEYKQKILDLDKDCVNYVNQLHTMKI